MRRPAVPVFLGSLVLALTAAATGASPLLGAQDASTPAPTEYFPPYDRDYGTSGAMIVPLGDTALPARTDAAASAERAVEAAPAANGAGAEGSMAAPARDERLVLVQIRLDDGATDPIPNVQDGAEIISVDTGAVAFTFEQVDVEARVIRGVAGDLCSGDGCPLHRVLAESGPEIVLLPGDRIVHNGPARYTYRLDPNTPVPAPGAEGTGLVAPGFAAPGALPALACSGGCRARLTIACSGGCRY